MSLNLSSSISDLPLDESGEYKTQERNLRLFISTQDLAQLSRNARYVSATVYVQEPNLNAALSAATFFTAIGNEVQGLQAAADAGDIEPVRIGQTEVTRKYGRYIEFARSFNIKYIPNGRQVLRLHFYVCQREHSITRTLLGVSEVPLQDLYDAKASRVNVPITFSPSLQVKEKRRRKGAGTAMLVAEDISVGLKRFYLDVQSDEIIRQKAIVREKALAHVRVRRVFYTLHIITSKDEKNSDWVLAFRSKPVQMVKKKSDGGSTEYNYFSSRPLVTAPGVVISDRDSNEFAANVFRKMHLKIKNRYAGFYFSLPSSEIMCRSPRTRVRLSLYEDHQFSFERLAYSEFTFAELRKMDIGSSTDILKDVDIVGQASLKFVESSARPMYFCLSLQMPNLR